MHRDLKTSVFTALVILTNVLGNFALSWGMKHDVKAFSASPVFYLRALFSPWVFLGTSLLIVWLLSRMTLLSWADLSYVLPVTSIAYAMNTFIGKYFFEERISVYRWLGTLLIMAGMALVGVTCPRTGALPSEEGS